MSLFGRFRFWASTRFPEVICPRYDPDTLLSMVSFLLALLQLFNIWPLNLYLLPKASFTASKKAQEAARNSEHVS